MFTLILLVFAFVLACIAAFLAPGPEPHYPRLVALALAFFFLAFILGDKLISARIGN